MSLSSTELEAQLERVRDLESRLTFRMSVLSKLLDQQSQELLRGYPINLTSYRVMNVVNTFNELSISDISRFTAMDRAQISRTAAQLEKQGLVTFAEDRVSKRKKNVRLTDKGQELFDEILPLFLKRQKNVREHIGEEAYQNLLGALNKLADLLPS